MVLAIWQATITDEAGNLIDSPSIEVRREVGGAPLVSLFEDRNGTTSLGNPFAAGTDGFAAFHVAGGAYQVKATKGAFERTWRYVGIGLASESDVLTTGLVWLFDAATADSDPGSGNLRLDNAAPGSVTEIYFDNQATGGADVTAWLDNLDDGGSGLDRGTLTLQGASGISLLVCRVTGSVVDATGYRRVSVTVLASSGTFTAGERLSVQFARAGIDGEVGGPDGGVVDNELALFDGATGKIIKGSATQSADVLKRNVTANLTAGYTADAFAAGTQSAGTYTPDPANSNLQAAINGGAHALAPPVANCTMVVQYTNNSSAGAITTSGFTLVDGDTISATDGDDFLFYITKVGSFSYLNVKALQ